MKRQLQRALFLPANRNLLFDLEMASPDILPKDLLKYYLPKKEFKMANSLLYGFLFQWRKKKKKAIPVLWKSLSIAQINGYKVILYPTIDENISKDEMITQFQFMRELGLVDYMLDGSQISDFEKFTNDYNINVQNSILVGTDKELLQEIAKRFEPFNTNREFKKLPNTRIGFFTFYCSPEKSYYSTNYYSFNIKNLYEALLGYSYQRSFVLSDIFIPALTDKIIYLEEEYNQHIHAFILENYNWICENIESKGCSFVYISASGIINATDFQSYAEDYLSYYYPDIEFGTFNLLKEYLSIHYPKLLGGSILELLNLPLITTPCLLRNRSSIINSKNEEFSFFPINRKKHLRVQFENYFSILQQAKDQGFVRFRSEARPKETADDKFFEDANQLAADVIEKINYLKSEGLNSLIAEIAIRMMDIMEPEIVKKIGASYNISELNTLPPKISRLRIEWTSKFDFQIILPDYGNMIVDMPRLPKAVFYLFLQHPEGILFDELPDYENELLVIYSRISNLSDQDEIRENVKRLVDPLDNSINVNCSRIKNAFVKLFDDNLAKNYYITGLRGKPKMITLSRDLVEIVDPWA